MTSRFLILLCGVVLATFAAWQPLVAEISVRELVAPDAAANDSLGSSTTATEFYTITGAGLDDNDRGVDAGAVYVFDAASGRMLRKLLAPDGEAGDEFGTCVAASGDFLVVGAPKHDLIASEGGAAYLFRLSSGAFIRKLGAGETTADDSFGQSVAIWGNYVMVGAPVADADFGGIPLGGAAFLYSLDNSALPVRIEATDATDSARFGQSVALDHFLIAVGAPEASRPPLFTVGSVHLFRINPATSEVTQEKTLFPADAVDGDQFGAAVAMHGNAMVVGEPFRTVGGLGPAGRVWLYPTLSREILSAAVSNSFAFLFGQSSGEQLGASVAISDMLVAVGTPLRNTSGGNASGNIRVQTYTTNVEEADPDSFRLSSPPGVNEFQLYGISVAAFGNRFAAGAVGDSGQGITAAGAVYQASPLRPPLGTRGFYVEPRTGTSAPGTGGATHSSFSEAYTANSETVVLSKLSGSSVSSASNKAVFGNLSGNQTRRIWNAVTPFAGLVVRDVYGLIPSATTGEIQGMAKLRGPGVTAANDLMLFRHDGTGMISNVREGDNLAPDVVVSGISNARACGALPAAAVLSLRRSTAVSPSSDTALFTAEVVAAREGDVSSFGAGAEYGQFSRLSSGTYYNATIAYSCGLQGTAVSPADNAALEVREAFLGGVVIQSVRKGQPAPALGGVGALNPFQTFIGEVVNNSDYFAFRAAMTTGGPVTSANNEGLWANTGPGDTLQLCVRKGDPATAPLVTFKRFLQFGLGSDKALLFLAQLAGPGVNASNDVSLWTHDGTSLRMLFREGDFAPGSRRGKIGVIQRVDVGFNNTYTVLCSLANEKGGVSASSNQMLLVGHFANGGSLATQRPSPILMKGQRYSRIGADRIASITFLSPNADPRGAMNCGLPQVIDYQVVFCQVQFSKTDKEMVRVFHGLP